MSITEVKGNTDCKMHRSLETLKTSLAKVRTGRTHAGILDHIMIAYYGNPTNLNQVASVALIDARTIGVQPWEKKLIPAIEKAIRESDMGLNPFTQGEMIRVSIPPLTEERRREIIKMVKNEVEDAKIAIRNIRRDANDNLKRLLRSKQCSEDEERRSQEEIQKLTDKFVSEIDKKLAEKEREILTI
jgi:ribosome recycling factor